MKRIFLSLFLILSAGHAYGSELSEYDIGVDTAACYAQNKDEQKAEDLIAAILLQEPGTGERFLDNDTLMDAIGCYIRSGNLQAAEDLIERMVTHAGAEGAGLLNYDRGLDTVRAYIKAGDFQNAGDFLRKMQEEYPDNAELSSLLAKVLFWQKKYNEAIEEYGRALEIQEDASLNMEMEKAGLARSLNKADLLIKGGDAGKAAIILRSLFDSGKGQYDSGYKLGMLYIRERDYEKAVDVFLRLKKIFPGDKDIASLYIEALILNGDIKKAKDELCGLPEKMKNGLYKEREDLFYRVKRNYVKASAGIYRYTKGIQDESNVSLEISRRVKEMTLVVAAGNINRFGMSDTQLTLDLYSRLGEKTKRWGYLSASITSDSDFLPKTVYGGEVYQGYGEFEFSLGYRRMNFRETAVDIIIPGIIIYLPGGFSLSERIYAVTGNNAYSLLSTLYYNPGHRFTGYYSIAIGKSAEKIQSLQDIQKSTTVSNKLSLEYRFIPSLSIGAEFSYEARSRLYNRYGANFFSRHWW